MQPRRILLLAATSAIALGLSSGASSCASDSGRAAQVDGGNSHPHPLAEASLGDDDGSDDSSAPSADGSIAGFTDGWTKVGWAPDCGLYVAATPAVLASVPSLKWGPCRSGRAGCQEMAIDWSPTVSYASEYAYSLAASPTGGTRLALSRFYDTNSSEFLIWDSNEGVVAAWREEGTSGLISHFGFEGGAFNITNAVFSQPDQVSSYQQILATDPLDLVARTSADYTFTSESIGFPNSLFMSTSAADSSLVEMFFDQTDGVVMRDRKSSATTPVNGTDGTSASVMRSGASLVGDTFIFTNNGNEIDTWSLAQGARALVKQTNTVTPHDVVTDGTTIAWLESTGGTTGAFASTTLYASPFTTDPAALQRRSLASIDCPTYACGISMSGGHVTISEWKPNATGPTAKHVAVVRLSDGARWTVIPKDPMTNPPFSESWADQGVVEDGELWLSGVVPASPVPARSLQRISLAALGTPDNSP